MKTDLLLQIRRDVLDEFLFEGDEAYEVAEKAVDLFLDFLEKRNIKEILITSSNVVEETLEITNTQDE